MSGPQSALYGAGVSRWITNPKHLNALVAVQSRILLKAGPTTSKDPSTAPFFTNLAFRGASASISVAATYVTICNLTGSGFFFNAVSPTHTAAFTPTFRITVDGTAYVIAPSAAQTAGNRMVIGPTTPNNSVSIAAAVATDVISPNAGPDVGFSAAMSGGVVVGASNDYYGIMTPEMILSYGLQCLRFESSLLVEVKCDLLSGTAVDKQCGATYRLDL